MQIREKKYNYLQENQLFSFKDTLWNGVKIQTFVLLETEKYLDYQKDLIQDFLADFIDKSNGEVYDEWDLKNNLEAGLQQLNEKLKMFAEKLPDIERFSIKWYTQIIAWNTLISSMIWDTSVLIFRDYKLYYKSYNTPNKKDKIDLFSWFIEWDIESWDEIVYAWTKISDILDQNDIDELERILAEDEWGFSDALVDMLVSRANKENIWYISNYYVHWNVIWWEDSLQSFKKKLPKFWRVKLNTTWAKNLFSNKYYVVVLVLSLVILFMLYAVLSQILKTWEDNSFVTESGTIIDITIDDIKKDIYAFQQMDASSDEKWIKYNEIVEKLTLLEQKWKWVEDVENLKWIVQDNYYAWFNIDRIQDMTAFDDLATWIKSRILTFNNTEKTKLWDLLSINYQNSLNVWWTDWALIGVWNDASRWNLIEYGVDATLAWCAWNLLKNWLFCYTKDGRIFNITKAWIEPIITAEEAWFPDTVWSIWTYSNYLYVFQPSLNGALNGIFGSRYKNAVAGSQTSFQAGQHYSLADASLSWMKNMTFGEVAIDSTFLTWSDWTLYQLWRPSAYGSKLEIRQVKLLGWDTINNKYSDNVKVIASLNSRYVYLFDRDNHTFTVYTSNPLKTNTDFNTTYNLNYLFSFQFDLKSEEVIDIAIPDASGNKPEMYVLTTLWINKIPLYDYINSIEKNDVLKATTPTSELE